MTTDEVITELQANVALRDEAIRQLLIPRPGLSSSDLTICAWTLKEFAHDMPDVALVLSRVEALIVSVRDQERRYAHWAQWLTANGDAH